MKTIVIIGLGNIGKRHLQAALTLKTHLSIYCVDIIKPDFKEINEVQKENIVFLNSLRELPRYIDVAIIATSSAMRRVVFEELVDNCDVKNVVFEKVLFQKETDYQYVDDLIKTRNIHAWVDCPRRVNPSWKIIKDLLGEDTSFTFIVSGGDWGFAGNVIHYLDAIKWLIGESDIQITNLEQYGEIYESKRIGYMEMCGIVEGRGGRCRHFSISCTPNNMKMKIYIISENRRITLLSDENEMVIEDNSNQWSEERNKMQPTYVSKTTKIVLTDLLERGKCGLISWEDSMNLHLMWIRTLSSIFEQKGFEKGLCPIT